MYLTILNSIHEYQHLSAETNYDPLFAAEIIFSAWEYQTYMGFLDDFFDTVIGDHVIDKTGETAMLMQITDRILLGIEAAYLLKDTAHLHDDLVVKEQHLKNDIMETPQLWCHGSSEAKIKFSFGEFPRSLKYEEVLNPFLVFQKLFKKKKDMRYWKKRLYLYKFLCQQSMVSWYDLEDDFDIIPNQRKFRKLIDAWHIIHVRQENRKKNIPLRITDNSKPEND